MTRIYVRINGWIYHANCGASMGICSHLNEHGELFYDRSELTQTCWNQCEYWMREGMLVRGLCSYHADLYMSHGADIIGYSTDVSIIPFHLLKSEQ